MDLMIAQLADGLPIDDKEQLFLVVAGVITVCAILCGSACSIVKTRSRERTRSEIAAYIAEGSMSPEDGERLMRAGEDED